MESSSTIHKKLQAYKRRFYLNLLIKGSLIGLTISLFIWLLAITLEYFGHLGVGWRTSLFYSVLAGIVAVVGWYVIRPMLQLVGILPQKTDEESAKEIGSALEEVDDRLVNLLNLQASAQGNRLAEAGIGQKAEQLSSYDFRSVVELKQNYRWLRWAVVPFAIMLGLFFLRPEILRDGSSRLVRYNQDFAPPAPFEFFIENDRLSVNENDDFSLSVVAKGPSIPGNAFIEMNGARFRLKQEGAGNFSYTFKNVRSDVNFNLSAAGITSEEFALRVLPAPKLTNLEAAAAFPAYTGLSNQVFKNRSNIRVPEGTRLDWNANVRNSTEVALEQNGVQTEFARAGNQQVAWSSLAAKDLRQVLKLNNEHGLQDSTVVFLEVIPDAFPGIEVAEVEDTTAVTSRYFAGELSDDYGLKRLEFVTEQKGQNGSVRSSSTPVPIANALRQQSFNFYWNFDSINLEAGDELEYYFVVHDNDGVNGSKSTRSQAWAYRAPDREELARQSEQVSQSTKSESEKSLEDFQQIEDELNKLKSELLQKKQPDWQDREKMKELLEKQKEIMKEMKKRSDKQQRQNEFENKFNQRSEELMEKQRQIEEMFDKLFDEEFKEKWEELNDLMEKMNKSQMLEELEQMKLDNEALEKELDRTLELFKQLEFEKQLEDQIKDAEKLAEDLKEQSEKTAKNEEEKEALQKEQEKLNEDLKNLEKGMEELKEKNEELEKPNSLPETDEEQQEAEEEMEKAGDNLDKNKQKKAGENQKNASEAVQKMGEKMKSFQQEMSQSQQSENMEDLRQLLENTVMLSKDQEALMADIKAVKLNDPKYTELTKTQKKLIDDAQVVEDSLLALSKRVPMLDKIISKELGKVQMNMERALDYLTNQPPNQQERYRAMATEREQYVMTSLNQLALLLDEVMQQMQSQMQQNMKGDGSCNKPGQGKKPSASASDLRKMQENLNKQLQKLKEAMEKGQNPNGKKPGDQQGMGMGGSPKEIARMAAQQSAIREQLREIANSLESGEGGKAGTEMKEIESLMEQTEEELLYRKISQQTINRQQEILTRLLQSEKAERERDMDEKRESKTALDDYQIPPNVWEEFVRQRQSEMELYQTTPPDLKPFYRNQVNSYFSGMSK